MWLLLVSLSVTPPLMTPAEDSGRGAVAKHPHTLEIPTVQNIFVLKTRDPVSGLKGAEYGLEENLLCEVWGNLVVIYCSSHKSQMELKNSHSVLAAG